MNTDSTQRSLTLLHQCGLSSTMMTIIAKQNITDDDLQIMDRDDVEHLFKNEYGFTFRERKHFWSILQKIQATTKADVNNNECEHSPEILEHIYAFAEENFEDSNCEPPQQQQSCASSHPSRQLTMDYLSEKKKSTDHDDDDKRSNASSYVSELSLSSDYIFTYPSILPSFSSNITQALQTNTIHKQWAAFINELARWVMSIKPCLREQHEYRAIGQTLYEKYPTIGTAGPKPWSFLCRSLSQRIRTERWQRRKTLAGKKRKESQMKKVDQTDHMTDFEILL